MTWTGALAHLRSQPLDFRLSTGNLSQRVRPHESKVPRDQVIHRYRMSLPRRTRYRCPSCSYMRQRWSLSKPAPVTYPCGLERKEATQPPCYRGGQHLCARSPTLYGHGRTGEAERDHPSYMSCNNTTS